MHETTEPINDISLENYCNTVYIFITMLRRNGISDGVALKIYILIYLFSHNARVK